MVPRPTCNNERPLDLNVPVAMKKWYHIEPEPWMQAWPMDTTRARGIHPGDILLRLCEEIHMRDSNPARTSDPIPGLRLRVRIGTIQEDRLRNNTTPHEIQRPGIIKVVLRQDLLFEMTPIAHSHLLPSRAIPCINRPQIHTRILNNLDTLPTRSLTPCLGLLLKAELYPNAMTIGLCP